MNDVGRHQSTAVMLDGQRQQRTLRRWARCVVDEVAEGAHVWPASALLTLGTLAMAVAWLSYMSVHDSSSTHSALMVETDLHDVVAALQHERQCTAAAAGRTSSSSLTYVRRGVATGWTGVNTSTPLFAEGVYGILS